MNKPPRTHSSRLGGQRRPFLLGCAAALAWPSLARSQSLPPMTDGPFYPPRAWRERWPDWDADLTRVNRPGSPAQAQGQALGLELTVADAKGAVIDGVLVEIWQCDALGHYHHPRTTATPGRFDPGFAGFGSATSNAQGLLRFRSIRPVPYPGRTPHIHIKLRHASFGEFTSQLFVAGEAANGPDFLWRQLNPAEQTAATLRLQAAAPDSGLKWQAQHRLVLPA